MLNRRKTKILEAIVSDYIASAEPIGSRTIAKRYDLGVSSATIRNEMSDLEDMGYILQPHSSSGRVPSDKGYRLYVDRVMPKKPLNKDHREYLKRAIAMDVNRIDQMMRDVARAVSHVTSYTAVAAEPLVRRHKIQHIQLVPVDDYAMAMMLITDLKAVKNQMVIVHQAPNHGVAGRMSVELTNLFKGASADDLCELFTGMARHRFAEIGFDVRLVSPLMDAVYAALASADNVQVYTSGMKNILDFPEFADLGKARAVVGTLEEKESLLTLLADNSEQITVIIGGENENTMLRDCSVIKAKIRINEHFSGNIAIIGPTRMDYSQVMTVLGAIVKNLTLSEIDR
ncbi:MAG: heat-inducible transcriptional repressor HrcA [Defluviitaleaceae bacterium]|nr:heat-inducible transcriptional repressor HrcA [Defluviitaleaceae bacterium]